MYNCLSLFWEIHKPKRREQSHPHCMIFYEGIYSKKSKQASNTNILFIRKTIPQLYNPLDDIYTGEVFWDIVYDDFPSNQQICTQQITTVIMKNTFHGPFPQYVLELLIETKKQEPLGTKCIYSCHLGRLSTITVLKIMSYATYKLSCYRNIIVVLVPQLWE